MAISVRQLIWILQLFFPPELTVQEAFYVLGVLISLYPILLLHANQRRAPHQPAVTGWMKSIQILLTRAFTDPANDHVGLDRLDIAEEYSRRICNDLDRLYGLLGLHSNNSITDRSALLSPPTHLIISTSRLNCKFCPVGDSNLVPSLRRKLKNNTQTIWVLDSSYHWVNATVVVGYCAKCRADYYPDRITRIGLRGKRTQVLEYDAEFLRVSNIGIWVHRKIAMAQEKALHRFHSGWSNFADWLNDTVDDINVRFTYRQSQRLFLEHFARRLLIAHGKDRDFECRANSTAKSLAADIRDTIGKNGGLVRSALTHGCIDCTHVKRYASQSTPGINLGGDADMVDSEEGPAGEVDTNDAAYQPLPQNMPETLPQQAAPPAGSPHGYARLAVMDGKTLTHKKCALDICNLPLWNFKNGRFCEEHLNKANVCGILPCGRPVHSPEALTCDDPSHIAWYKQYEARFHRLSFKGVQRVIRRQHESAVADPSPGVHGPSLHVQLQPLGETPGAQVAHTFKAKRIYCVETIQWACGVPIAWGKCYKSESTPQVLSFINKIWGDCPELRPGFIAYDKACDLLRHIVTQNQDDLWIKSTKFIVDAFHYINHRATDVLCRTRCNPAPMDGSQPDLVLTEVDERGVIHQTRAFNTETAEQLNSWLNGFESQLQQMTDVNFDFFVHVLMLIYGEMVEKKIRSKGKELTEEFWDAVNGVAEMDTDS
ncbi:hypothetical protein C8R45DRAFT_1054414 [Mycena sanguinolenta]|nr:hypothetical protein C8R45DRAFT_1054414 [Mycena sanguinolenta]